MRKISAVLLAVIMCMAASAGCGGKSLSSGGDIKILLSISEMDTFRQTLADAAGQAAQEKGIQLDVMDAQGVIENQMAHMQEAVSGGYDAVLCAPVNADTAIELKASAGDLPVIFCNSAPKEKHLSKDQYMYVGSDEIMAGRYQAEYVLEKLSGKDEINVVLFKGESSHSATSGRTKGVKQAFAESGKKVNYVFEDYADWSADSAMKMFDIFLKIGLTVDCVLCNNDSMALGVVDACKKAGIDLGTLPILGVDATAEGCQAVGNGEMAFTVYQSAAGQGKAAVETAAALASGASAKDIEGISEDGKYVWVPFEKVDSGNVGQYAQ